MDITRNAASARKELIEIADEQDRNYWAMRLGVSGEKLKTAVKAIQSMDFIRLKEYLTLEKIKSSNSFQRFL
ncbi:DUF3606 domain-containing protein [Pedobacter mucosus]|uniref:DUF3606 domain-containing protein n=1 Tax=Pedobacter mucosus TaxID=2895286 RepID=UPI001EE47E85|nr:DUF3606 domain-containing protein [Pedobacter mucosus]UKT65707.1 DUF3606 domain-containing protein [Pedobacter mucosus]